MVEDIFDPSNNKLTIEDRVSIAKKVIKSLGFTTIYDMEEASGNLENLAELSENEKKGVIYLFKPVVILEIREEVIRIRVMPFWNLDMNEFEKFYDKLIQDRFTSFCIRERHLDHSMIIPQISDEYFECYLRAVLTVANETFEYVRNAYEIYENFVRDN